MILSPSGNYGNEEVIHHKRQYTAVDYFEDLSYNVYEKMKHLIGGLLNA